MIFFDVRLGRFSMLVLHETVKHSFKVTREGPGEFVFDLPFASITFTNHRKAEEL